MRILLYATGLLLAATFTTLAILIVASGRTFVFAINVGYPREFAGVALASAGIWIGAAAALALHLAARAVPKTYFHLLWWRDLAIFVAAACLLFVTASAVWRQLAYGLV